MGTAVAQITVDQFVGLDLPEDREWELHNGKIVDKGQPSLKHRHVQGFVKRLLEEVFPEADVTIEYTFETSNDVRSADVGATTKERARSARHGLIGAPEFVVEVLSASNTVTALKEYRRLCFANGTEVFLTLDANDRSIELHLKGEKLSRIFGPGEVFEIQLFGRMVSLAVDQFFAEG